MPCYLKNSKSLYTLSRFNLSLSRVERCYEYIVGSVFTDLENNIIGWLNITPWIKSFLPIQSLTAQGRKFNPRTLFLKFYVNSKHKNNNDPQRLVVVSLIYINQTLTSVITLLNAAVLFVENTLCNHHFFLPRLWIFFVSFFFSKHTL